MRNNFVTVQYSTEQNLLVYWREFSTTWQHNILKIVNGRQGETTRQKKMNAVKYENEQTFFEYFDI